MTNLQVTAEQLAARTILRKDLVADRSAFLDTKIPGSAGKINYPLVGPGVSENPEQVIPVTEPHGFSLGAAVMPAGVVNNLHSHYTAEVFSCFAGEWLFRWGVDGTEGEAVVRDGDVISIPTWIFRGFTSLTDNAWLFTGLGRDESGGLIWAPSVISESAKYGMHLTANSRIIETEPGEFPAGVELVRPLSEDDLGSMRHVTAEQMRRRLATPDDLEWSNRPFLDSTLPDGGARLATVVGYGVTEDRDQEPRIHNPHGFTLAWLKADSGRGVGLHRHQESQVLIVKDGRWRVTLNEAAKVSVELGPYDTVSIPPGAWRCFESIGDETGQLVMITGGDGRTTLEWSSEVVSQALAAGVVHDADGYLAPAHLVHR